MERSHLRPGALIDLTFLTDERASAHAHEDIEMVFVVSGRVSYSVGEKTAEYTSGDLVVANAGQEHSYRSLERSVIARFLISNVRMQELLGVPGVLFWCDSVSDENEGYAELRRIIGQILNQTICATSENRLLLNSLHYQLLNVLAENFSLQTDAESLVSADASDDDRMERINAYIKENYRDAISLTDLSDMLFLSPTYVSKYIRSHCGVTFLQLLNSVRLGYAVEDLLYTAMPVTKVALENGFASVAAFNKVFKDAYGQTPSVFRKEHTEVGSSSSVRGTGKDDLMVHESVRGYLEKNLQTAAAVSNASSHLELDFRREPIFRWDRAPVKMVNAGAAAGMLSAKMQAQILTAKRSIDFEYVRFWGLFEPDMCLDIHAATGSQNFTRVDEVTDFLVANRLKPHIELLFKTGHPSFRGAGGVVADGRARGFSSEAEMRGFYSSLFAHFIARYGSYEVSSWVFECWERPVGDGDRSETLQYALMTESDHRRYFADFSIIAEELRRLLPVSCIGGAGFPARVYGEDNLARILSVWKDFDQAPDYISITCYPYRQEKIGRAYYEKRTSDLGFVRYGVNLTRSAAERAGFGQVPVRVMEYNLTLCPRNVINDSCLKAAFMMSNAIACAGEADTLGYALLSDYSDEGCDTGAVLFGGRGLLTVDGMRKPAFGALSFLNLLYPDVQYKNKNCLVTRNARGSMRLVCHNLKKPNYNYYRLDEEDLAVEDLVSIQADGETLCVSLKMAGMEDGEYQVKTRLINRHHGSVQDKWADMGLETALVPEEMEYLRASSLGEILVCRGEAEGGVLELQWDMEPNEIRYVHIYRR